jgi:hypothetical protein
VVQGGAEGAGGEMDFVLYLGCVAAELFLERDFEVALFYFGNGDGVGFAGFGEGVAEELAFGGVEERVGGEDFFEGREGAGCGHEDGAACDSILLGMQNVH